MENSWKKKIKTFWRSWGYSILVAVIIATSFKSAVADWNVVPTGSMKPTILEGDRIFVNKLAYDLKIPYTTLHIAEWGAPQRGDIVVFYSPLDDKRLVKRVVGVPGDSIAMQNDQLIINGEKIMYEPIPPAAVGRPSQGMGTGRFCFSENLNDTRHPVMITPQRPALRSFGPVVVPDGKYFMMGDNRDNSADSRYIGFIDRSCIVGQATSVVISLDINDNYKPRWARFFSQLP
ncbi:MAG: signal peptidase I [Thermodesulfobacteriota bacterium]|nr:signal peptidase I [Thermodesulfobacteriota bacterium]